MATIDLTSEPPYLCAGYCKKCRKATTHISMPIRLVVPGLVDMRDELSHCLECAPHTLNALAANSTLARLIHEQQAKVEMYEYLRTLSVPEFEKLVRENLSGNGAFDGLVRDAMLARKKEEEIQNRLVGRTLLRPYLRDDVDDTSELDKQDFADFDRDCGDR